MLVMMQLVTETIPPRLSFLCFKIGSFHLTTYIFYYLLACVDFTSHDVPGLKLTSNRFESCNEIIIGRIFPSWD